MELYTPRLVLRPMTTEHAVAVLAYRGDREVARYLADEDLTFEQARARLVRAGGRWPDRGDERFNFTLAVTLDGSVIGDVHAWNTDEPLQPTSDDPREVWLGYALDPRHHGQGYAAEAVGRLITWLGQLGAVRIYANTYLANTASVALLRRLGFERDLVFDAGEDECGKGLPSGRYRLGLDRGPAG